MINNTVLPRVSLILSITFYFSPRKKKSEDTKGVIRSYELKETKYDCQKKEDNRTTSNMQSTTQKTKDQATRTPQKIG
jgi:hypothetical protein